MPMDRDFIEFKATGSGAMAETLGATLTGPFAIDSIQLHLSAAGGAAENFTATMDANAGTAYDTLLYSRDMETVTDIVQNYNEPLTFRPGDEIDFAYANGNTRDWGLSVHYRLEN